MWYAYTYIYDFVLPVSRSFIGIGKCSESYINVILLRDVYVLSRFFLGIGKCSESCINVILLRDLYVLPILLTFTHFSLPVTPYANFLVMSSSMPTVSRILPFHLIGHSYSLDAWKNVSYFGDERFHNYVVVGMICIVYICFKIEYGKTTFIHNYWSAGKVLFVLSGWLLTNGNPWTHCPRLSGCLPFIFFHRDTALSVGIIVLLAWNMECSRKAWKGFITYTLVVNVLTVYIFLL